MNPQDYPKRLLVAVTGLSPQVVTETLYALAVMPQHPSDRFVPTEVHIITTEEGAQRITLSLLHKANGWFHKLCTEYHLPEINFDVENIHVLHNSNGQPLKDIRSPEDNERTADEISEIMRKFSKDENSALHVSIAGGRKTMSFYLGYALSLYGRKQDRLSHVLVSKPYESHREFFYPSKNSEVIHTPPPHNKSYDKQKARVTLAEIPFVRLREGLEDLLDSETKFSTAVSRAQQALPPVSLELQPDNCKIIAGGEALQLGPSLFAYYWMLAERARDGTEGFHWKQADSEQQIMQYYEQLVGPYSGRYEKKEIANRIWDNSYCLQSKSKIKRHLQTLLGKKWAQPYLITDVGTVMVREKPYKCQGIDIAADKIHIRSSTSRHNPQALKNHDSGKPIKQGTYQ